MITKKERFHSLRDQWQKETGHMSNSSQIVAHQAYRKVVNMGHEAVPWIIEDIRTNGTTFWWTALYEILKSGPHVPDYAQGKVMLLNEMWLAWYEFHHERKPYRP